jgi:hypothetical protein
MAPASASIRRQRDSIVRREPQHDRFYLFRIPGLTTRHYRCTFTPTPDAVGLNPGRAVQLTPTGEARKRRTCRRSAL